MDGSFASRASTAFANPYAFTGRRFDPESGLYYYRARYYHVNLGRFLSRDPIWADRSLYSYVENNPTNAVDPSGLLSVTGPHIYAWTAQGNGFPADSVTGGAFRIYRGPRDGTHYIQDVHVSGSLTCTIEDNKYNYVRGSHE